MHYQHYDDDENHYYCNNHDYYRHCYRLLLVVVRHDRNKNVRTEAHRLRRFARTGWQSLPTSLCLCKRELSMLFD